MDSYLTLEEPVLLRDLSGRKRKVAGILRPQDQVEVRKMIQWASSAKARLQPISCGKNWGFGSHLPEEENVYLLDLSNLNKIREVNWNNDWVELEPGVTQGTLDSMLADHGRSHYFNVTGAGRQTSIIGNSLERGIGYFGGREEDILDLEVMLEDGSLLWTSNFPSNPFHTGLGPNLRGLFFQSNFGIITAARFKLRKRPACMGVILAPLNPTQSIARLIDGVAGLRREGLFCTVPHIGNRQRLLSTFGPVGSKTAINLSSAIPEWTCAIPVSGPKQVVGAIFSEITQRLEGISDCQLISPDLAPVDQRYANLVDLALGIPNDFAMAGVANAALSEITDSSHGVDLDAGRAGLIHVTPTCAANELEVNRLLSLIATVRSDFQFSEIPMTLNLINPGLIAVINSIPFDRQKPDSLENARVFANQLLSACGHEGFLPYRLGLEEAALLPTPCHNRSIVLRKLQVLFASQNTFGSSKYSSLWAGHNQTASRRSSRGSPLKRKSPQEVCA